VNDADLIRLVDRLEAEAEPYLTLQQVEAAAQSSLAEAIAAGLLLIDYRHREDGAEVTLCRLNRRHPTVIRLTAW
jgi:hypothetical protein